LRSRRYTILTGESLSLRCERITLTATLASMTSGNDNDTWAGVSWGIDKEDGENVREGIENRRVSYSQGLHVLSS
jgi:hypothetical protein